MTRDLIGFSVMAMSPQPDLRAKAATVGSATVDDKVDLAENSIKMVAKVVSAYYRELIEQGIPDEYARELTTKMHDPILELVKEGMAQGAATRRGDHSR
jgi:hypothetical protein